MREMRILISGFDPIWGIKKTPSGELAKMWQSEDMPKIPGLEVRSVILPQMFTKSTELLCDEIASFNPDGVVMLGATTKNDPIRLERFAVNCESSAMGDNSRIPVKDRQIVPGGPAAYESTLPVHHLVERLASQGITSKASHHAGTHVCNSIMYGVMHWLATKRPGSKTVAGFVHVSFPDSFGVVEDDLWDTEKWPKLQAASVVLIQELAGWLASRREPDAISEEVLVRRV